MSWIAKIFFKAAYAEGRRDAFREAATMVRDRREFEMYDSEGRSLERYNRSRALFEVELELWGKAKGTS